MKRGELYHIASDVLGKKGAFASEIPDWRASAEQLEYARCVCTWLEARHFGSKSDTRAALATLEGATGIGKTFGYLVPLLTYAQLTGRRVAVATHTLQLLRDIVDRSLPMANRILATHLELPMLSTGERVGLAEHVSAERVSSLMSSLDIASPAREKLESLHLFALGAREGKTSGYLREWIMDSGGLPESIQLDQVCLKSWCSSEDMRAYEDMKARAKSASVQVITQAHLLMHCARYIDVVSGGEGHEQVDAVVVDEADHIENVGQSVLSAHLSVNDVLTMMNHIERNGEKLLASHMAAIRQANEAIVEKLNHADEETILTGQKAASISVPMKALIGELQSSLAVLNKLPAVSGDDEWRHDVGVWTKRLDRFVQAYEAQSTYHFAYIRKSPILSNLGLGVMSTRPGDRLSELWRTESKVLGVNAVLLTSATLAPATEKGFQWYWRTVGINPTKHRIIEAGCEQLEPRRYGNLSFVYADPRASRPFKKWDENDSEEWELPELSAEWVSYAAQMIRAAHEEGGRTLVLCPAYNDCEVLADRLRSHGLDVIEGRRGQIKSEMAMFLECSNAIWLSPAVWEGLDMPGMIAHIVIPRVPYIAFKDGIHLARQRALVARGYSEDAAKNIIRNTVKFQASRKLRQGIGRAIRKDSDRAKVWFADNRIQLQYKLADSWVRQHREKMDRGDTILGNAIPIRFRNKAASIFTIDGQFWS